jgi:hypothetical protein
MAARLQNMVTGLVQTHHRVPACLEKLISNCHICPFLADFHLILVAFDEHFITPGYRKMDMRYQFLLYQVCDVATVCLIALPTDALLSWRIFLTICCP